MSLKYGFSQSEKNRETMFMFKALYKKNGQQKTNNILPDVQIHWQ